MGAKQSAQGSRRNNNTWSGASTVSLTTSDKKRQSKEDRTTNLVCLSDFKFERNFMLNIGRGGFGRVLALTHRETGNYFAVKSLVKAKLVARGQVKNALNEFEILKSLEQSRFIVNMWYAFQDKHSLYLALDLMLGGSVAHALQRQPDHKFSEYRARFYMAELVLGIQFLHSRHIIHRDIKPDNLLIDGDGHLRITDFNASLMMPENVDPRQAHSEGWGTRDFRAPEIYLRQGAGFMYACDWWSAGSTLYVMLTGKKPYARREMSGEAYVRKIVDRDFNSSWGPDGILPSKASSLFCQQLLEANPSLRVGCSSGPAGEVELMTNPFFDGIDWDALERHDASLEVPWIPNIDEAEVTSSSASDAQRGSSESSSARRFRKQSKKGSDIQSYSQFFDSTLDHEERMRVLQRNMGMLGFDGFDDYYGSSDEDDYRTLSPQEQSLFDSWNYSVDARREVEALPEFAVLQQVSAMEPTELKEFVSSASTDKLELICGEMKRLHSVELQENFEKVQAVMKVDALEKANSDMNTKLLQVTRELQQLRAQMTAMQASTHAPNPPLSEVTQHVSQDVNLTNDTAKNHAKRSPEAAGTKQQDPTTKQCNSAKNSERIREEVSSDNGLSAQLAMH